MQAGPDHAGERGRRQPVERREPRPVDDPDAAHGDPCRAHLREHDPRAAGGRAHAAVERPQVLEQHLRDEVVAVAVHLADDRREPRRAVDGDRHGPARGAPERVPADDGDAPRDERVPERAGGEERRGQRGPPVRAVDDERGERRRLAAHEVPLPAGSAADRVVGRLVAADASGHPANAGRAHRSRQARDIRARQRGVAVAHDVEIAVPRRADALPRAEHLGAEPVARTEQGQSGPGDRELLVRRRNERPRGVVGVEHLATRRVDGDRGRLTEREVRRAEGLREAGRKVAAGGRRRGRRRRREQQAEKTDEREPRAHHLGG